MGSPFRSEAEAKTGVKGLVAGLDGWCRGRGIAKEARVTEANMGVLARTLIDEHVWQQMLGRNVIDLGR